LSSAGQSDIVGPSDRLHFLLVRFLYASKENERIQNDGFHTSTCSILLAQKGTQKGHPGCPGPSGCLALLAVEGTLKTHRLRRFKQVQRLILSTAPMLSGTEWDYNPKIGFLIIYEDYKSPSRNDRRNLQSFIYSLHDSKIDQMLLVYRKK
jgi:hypothetical protein